MKLHLLEILKFSLASFSQLVEPVHRHACLAVPCPGPSVTEPEQQSVFPVFTDARTLLRCGKKLGNYGG